MLHGQPDALTHPAYAAIRAHAWRRSRYAVATLPDCIRACHRAQSAGWSRCVAGRLMRVRTRPGLGPASDYRINSAFWGRRAA